MPKTPFDLNHQAAWYSRLHLKTDPGVVEIHYLPVAPDREIRLIEVNDMMPEMRDDCLEPLDLGVDRGQDVGHRLLIMDVTPSQWEKIKTGQIPLPQGWSLQDATSMSRPAS